MKIKSENIGRYIYLNYDIKEFNDIKELEKVDELVINSLNYSLKISLFYPKELLYFKKLKKCTFINFTITDEIINNLNKIGIEELTLDNCTCNTDTILNIEKLYLSISKINYKNIEVKEMLILECGIVDINDLLNKDIKKLSIMNCNIINSKLLEEFLNCKIELIGSTLDDNSIIKLPNINYNPNKYIR